MDKQDVFDTVALHLLMQGGRATRKHKVYGEMKTICAYRGVNQDGKVTKCAFGCLIPDDLYDENMENRSAMELISSRPALASHLKISDIEKEAAGFIDRLQFIHDNSLPTQWAIKLKKLAESLGLSGKVVEDFEAELYSFG